jgi:protein-L-isoaspartate(D-aspartate) O-methyltransferase
MSFLPDDRAEERKKMVETQIAARGINTQPVLESMLTVPRHYFVPEKLKLHAYEGW